MLQRHSSYSNQKWEKSFSYSAINVYLECYVLVHTSMQINSTYSM